ncbi:MAG TPA: hypothetical protein VGH32_11860 [Pirellulales bacterium]
MQLELQGRGVCREIALPYLSRNDFDRCVSRLLFIAARRRWREARSLLSSAVQTRPRLDSPRNAEE